MDIIYQTTKNKKAIINAINSQQSVKDHLNEVFNLKNVVVYQQGKEDGGVDTVSCFFVQDEQGCDLVVSSISAVVFNGVEGMLEVLEVEPDQEGIEDMQIIFHSRKTNSNRDCIYFEVR